MTRPFFISISLSPAVDTPIISDPLVGSRAGPSVFICRFMCFFYDIVWIFTPMVFLWAPWFNPARACLLSAVFPWSIPIFLRTDRTSRRYSFRMIVVFWPGPWLETLSLSCAFLKCTSMFPLFSIFTAIAWGMSLRHSASTFSSSRRSSLMRSMVSFSFIRTDFCASLCIFDQSLGFSWAGLVPLRGSLVICLRILSIRSSWGPCSMFWVGEVVVRVSMASLICIAIDRTGGGAGELQSTSTAVRILFVSAGFDRPVVDVGFSVLVGGFPTRDGAYWPVLGRPR